MASINRVDRQLMRQRGAGMRNVNNVEFGLNFDSQSSRDDRQLMRQRGAGNRNVGNIDFGFSFPTPTQTRRSSRTPRSTRGSVERSLKTPASTRAKSHSAVTSSDATLVNGHEIQANQQRSTKTPPASFRAERPNSSKKRKLNDDGVHPGSQKILVNVPVLPQIVQQPSFVDSELPLLSSVHDHNKENEIAKSDPPAFTSYSKRRTTIPDDIDVNNDLEIDTSVTDSVLHSIEVLPPGNIQRDGNDSSEVRVGKQAQRPHGSNLHGLNALDTNEQYSKATGFSQKPAKRRKKRKQVILGRRKRRSSEGVRLSSVGEETVEFSDSIHDIEVEDEQPLEQAVERGSLTTKAIPLWKRLAARQNQGRPNRLSVSASPVRGNLDNEEGDETYVDEDFSPEPMTPALQKKKPKDRSRSNRSGRGASAGQQAKDHSKTYPITTYRITNTQFLPTIMEERETEDASETDLYPIPPSFSTRTQPNAVDVLQQICCETIQSAIEKLETNSTAATSRAEIRNSRAALEAFGESLKQRLTDMSEAVENRTTLEARLRRSKREKTDLQARWIAIRRQRDDLALKADTIRRQNWDNDEEIKRQWEVSELAHKTELELGRNDPGGEDLELMLKQVAGCVSRTGGRGGILDKVRTFNSRLERIAVALEGR